MYIYIYIYRNILSGFKLRTSPWLAENTSVPTAKDVTLGLASQIAGRRLTCTCCSAGLPSAHVYLRSCPVMSVFTVACRNMRICTGVGVCTLWCMQVVHSCKWMNRQCRCLHAFGSKASVDAHAYAAGMCMMMPVASTCKKSSLCIAKACAFMSSCL